MVVRQSYSDNPSFQIPYQCDNPSCDLKWHVATVYSWEGQGEPPDSIYAIESMSSDGDIDGYLTKAEIPSDTELDAAYLEYHQWVLQNLEDPLNLHKVKHEIEDIINWEYTMRIVAGKLIFISARKQGEEDWKPYESLPFYVRENIDSQFALQSPGVRAFQYIYPGQEKMPESHEFADFIPIRVKQDLGKAHFQQTLRNSANQAILELQSKNP